ncbi:hypothetical protein JCM14467A_21530 [Vulcanisaeta sp. JCM 14467]
MVVYWVVDRRFALGYLYWLAFCVVSVIGPGGVVLWVVLFLVVLMVLVSPPLPVPYVVIYCLGALVFACIGLEVVTCLFPSSSASYRISAPSVVYVIPTTWFVFPVH